MAKKKLKKQDLFGPDGAALVCTCSIGCNRRNIGCCRLLHHQLISIINAWACIIQCSKSVTQTMTNRTHWCLSSVIWREAIICVHDTYDSVLHLLNGEILCLDLAWLEFLIACILCLDLAWHKFLITWMYVSHYDTCTVQECISLCILVILWSGFISISHNKCLIYLNCFDEYVCVNAYLCVYVWIYMTLYYIYLLAKYYACD